MAQLNTRIIHKHDTEENWKKAVNFIPKQGETIVYDKDSSHDYVRIKIGDGTTLVNSLPFYGPDKINYATDDGEWIEKFGEDIPVLTANNTFTGTNNFKTLARFQEIKPDKITDVSEISGDGDTRIKYLAEPQEGQDAATKYYVDNGLKLKAGLTTDNTFTGTNTFSGKVTISTTPTANNDAVNKAYVDEKSKTAEKLATSRKIGINGNGISTAVSFDGSANINIPLTGFYNTGLLWSSGSGDTAGSVTPLGAALAPNFNANRLAYLSDDAIEVEYSTDGGDTWTDCTNSGKNLNLTTLFQDISVPYSIGNKQANGAKASINDKLRITLTSTSDNNQYIYCNLRKIFLYVTTNGATGNKVLIEKATIGAPDTFTTVKESNLSGWSGWNEINTSLIFGGNKNQTSQVGKLRFTFSITGVHATYSSALSVSGIYFIGENNWYAKSTNLAKTGHIYSIGANQACTFPGNVTTQGDFIGDLQGKADKATSDASGNNIESTYLKKVDNPIVVSDTEPTNSNTQIWIDIS